QLRGEKADAREAGRHAARRRVPTRAVVVAVRVAGTLGPGARERQVLAGSAGHVVAVHADGGAGRLADVDLVVAVARVPVGAVERRATGRGRVAGAGRAAGGAGRAGRGAGRTAGRAGRAARGCAPLARAGRAARGCAPLARAGRAARGCAPLAGAGGAA